MYYVACSSLPSLPSLPESDALALLFEGSIQRGADGVVVLSEYPFELDHL